MPDLLDGRAANAHLLRRAGFGPSHAHWDALKDLPYEGLVDMALGELGQEAPAEPDGFDVFVPGSIQDVWLERMRTARIGLAEKLAFFWHGHFATSNTKVKDPALMWAQYALFREDGAGRFRDLVLGVSRDVAMIRWLDGNANRKGTPNENYARELQELFTLGIGHYTEQDIREIARAFTGWGSRSHDFVFRPQFHDKGSKNFHGETGAYGGEDVVRIVTGLPRCAAFICTKLLRFFHHPDPTVEEIGELTTAWTSSDGTIRDVLRAMFLAPWFRSARSERVLVTSPVEFAIGALRQTNIDPVPSWLHGSLDRMGQILFRPPSVKGWTRGSGWLSSGGVVERLRVSQRLASLAEGLDAEALVARTFPAGVPATLTKALEDATGKDLVTLVLACPENQLA